MGANGEPIEHCVGKVLEYLEGRGIIPKRSPDIIELFVPEDKRASKTAYAETLPKLDISKLSMQWLQVLAEGWASPLTGFMREREFLQTLHFNAIAQEGGASVSQAVPIVLPCTEADKERIGAAGVDAIALVYEGKVSQPLSTTETTSTTKTSFARH